MTFNHTDMAETNNSLPDTLPEDTSDYGDFGSDVEERQILDDLLAQVASEHEELRDTGFIVTDIEDYEPPRGVLLPKNIVQTHLLPARHDTEAAFETLRDREAKSADSNLRRASPGRAPTPPAETIEPDNRSPLERFRKPPRKALSVTDLVSPSWCELQYFYVLSKHGRKRRTPAMKQGSKVHKSLEEEVHVTVHIETTKIEDSWALRFWNICQGLKSLRETGRTRELEIWGVVGGELVNGIIDELSYECPDPKYEENVRAKGTSIVDLPEYQTSITEYLLAKPEASGAGRAKKSTASDSEWIYMTDIKTRATPTLPTGSSLRPTVVQLHLYHHMLENLVQGNFSLDRLTERYDINPSETFSDSFLAQLGNLNQDIFSQSSGGLVEEQVPPASTASSQDSMDILLQHNTLSTLWTFMMNQFRETFLLEDKPSHTLDTDPPPQSQQSTSDLPTPPVQPTRLSPLLTASYMSSTYNHAPSSATSSSAERLLGRKSFQFSPAFLHAYLSESLSWWRGEREAKGVTLQEAWKCRSCDFKNECAWILERDQRAFDEAMERKRMREIARVDKGKSEATAFSRSKV